MALRAGQADLPIRRGYDHGLAAAKLPAKKGKAGMKVGFIGLGKLANKLLRSGFDLTVRDLDSAIVQEFVERGGRCGDSPAQVAADCDVIITCLPSPAASAAVLEGDGGILKTIGAGKIWAEMSTTDATEVRRLADAVEARGASAMDCPVSGGCHRAASGNISIFAGGERAVFERMMPLLTKSR